MTNRYKRKLEDFDPNKSDSDDGDYDAASPPARPQGRGRKSRDKPRKTHKRQRKATYGDSSEDIEFDDNDESDEGSFEESEDNEDTAVNPRTGRRMRTTAKKPIKYEESDEAEEESERDPIQPTPRKKARRMTEEPRESLLVTLKMSPASLESTLRPLTGGKGPRTREATPKIGGLGTRRSSRISQDDQEPLVALTNSGKHEVITRAGTATPEPPSSRKPQRATTGLKKPPSAIMEVSQEGTQAMDYEALMDEDDDIGVHPDMTTSAYGDTQPIDDDEDELAQPGHRPLREPEINESADEDEGPVNAGRRLRDRRKDSTPPRSQGRRSLRPRKTGAEPSSDFEPDAEGEVEDDDGMSDSDGMLKPPRLSSNEGSRLGRGARSKGRASQRSRSAREESEEDELDIDELADEAADLEEDSRRNRRSRRRGQDTESQQVNLRTRGTRPDYRVFRPENLPQDEDDAAPATATPTRGRKGASAPYRSLFQTAGPFGGMGGPVPLFGGAEGQGAAAGGVDSDSSDDDMGIKQVGGAVGMTPTSAFPKPYAAPQAHNNDPVVASGGGPAGLGKVKDRKALADADPLGVDPNVGFESVGGLDDHIDRLKEMVMLPLLYPEVFQRFHVTPPRGVLFHGPPGTGKTLLARALSSSVSSNGRKVTFYMRKGADALSKWVGEAEKQLRLLFEEARKNQPSIIFFDEIDGLAPVRSSKQEQIHASIVATLLALMDGMDGRGQVIVIGATNRPDSVDPALRRPGRFDREFYFPLPSLPARRSIIDIHTKGWEPPLEPRFKDQLAELTKGYGGADLRALCTEAALNAVQGTYPQIYASDRKLVIDPTTIKVLAKDFMISVGKIVPSSERSAASGAAPLKKEVEPLLRKAMSDIMDKVDKAIPRKRKATALEEAMYDDRDDERGFERETMQRQFEAARVFRPRLLIKGLQGMGQQYLGSALLAKLEGVHVQNFGLPVLLADTTRSPEAAIVQLFEEVKRHKPSIVYIPNIDTWYKTLSESAIKTFAGLMRSLQPTEPVLLLGVLEYLSSEKEIDNQIIRDLFSYSLKAQYKIERPSEEARNEYFKEIVNLVRQPPTDFPNPDARKRRKLDVLPVAAADPVLQLEPSKADLKAQKKKDRTTLNVLKIQIQSVMDQIKLKYKKFRTPVIDDSAIAYLFDDENPQLMLSDLPAEQQQDLALLRPYEIDKDEKGAPGLREIATRKFYYNLEIITIEKRLSNGYYKRPKDFLADIKRLAKDAKTIGDQDRILKANEMLANVEVDMATLETHQPALVAECEAVYERELLREAAQARKERDALRNGEDVPVLLANVPPPVPSKTTTETTGPVVLGEELDGRKILPPHRPLIFDGPSSGSNPMAPPNGSKDSEMYDASVDPRPLGRSASMPNPALDTPINPKGSYHTQLPFNSQLDPIQNSASTTSSGLKTGQNSSDKNKSSGQNSAKTNASLPHSQYPNFGGMSGHGGSQLPDTQSSQSQPEPTSPVTAPTAGAPGLMPPPAKPTSLGAPAEATDQVQRAQTQPMLTAAIPQQPSVSATQPAPVGGPIGSVTQVPLGSGGQPARASRPTEYSPEKPDNPLAVTALLNEATPEPTPSHPQLIMDETVFGLLHTRLSRKTSGLSVEQLEQVYSSLMGAIWETKGEWNRVKVSKDVETSFNDIIDEIGECQRILKASQEDE